MDFEPYFFPYVLKSLKLVCVLQPVPTYYCYQRGRSHTQFVTAWACTILVIDINTAVIAMAKQNRPANSIRFKSQILSDKKRMCHNLTLFFSLSDRIEGIFDSEKYSSYKQLIFKFFYTIDEEQQVYFVHNSQSHAHKLMKVSTAQPPRFTCSILVSLIK